MQKRAELNSSGPAIRKSFLTMLFKFDWDIAPGGPLPVLDPTCWEGAAIPPVTPFVTGRAPEGGPPGGWPDMTEAVYVASNLPKECFPSC